MGYSNTLTVTPAFTAIAANHETSVFVRTADALHCVNCGRARIRFNVTTKQKEEEKEEMRG